MQVSGVEIRDLAHPLPIGDDEVPVLAVDHARSAEGLQLITGIFLLEDRV